MGVQNGRYRGYDSQGRKANLKLAVSPGAGDSGRAMGLRADGYHEPYQLPPLGIGDSLLRGGTHLLSLPNGNFEDGLAGWGVQNTDANCSSVVDATTSITGQNTILMSVTKSGGVTQIDSGLVPAGEGIPITVGLRMMAASGSPTCILQMAYFDKTKTQLTGTGFTNTTVAVPTSMQETISTFTPPTGTRYVMVNVNCYSTVGQIRLDEVRVTRSLPAGFVQSQLGIISVKSYGAKGDARQVNVSSVTSGSTTIPAAAGTFSQADKGKWIVVQGAGTKASGDYNAGSLVTTIVSVASDGSSVVVAAAPGTTASSLTTTSTTSAGVVSSASTTPLTAQLGTDDTAAVKAAIGAAAAIGGGVYFPSGGYGLYSSTSSIPLGGVTLIGEGGAQPSGADYTHCGSTILIIDKTNSAFSLTTGTNMRGMSFYYPMQDGATTAPLVYPALMTGTAITCCNFHHCTFVNPYVLMDLPSSSGNLGDVRLSDCRAFAVSTYFHFVAPAYDVLDCTGCFFSPGVYGDRALYNFQYLTNASGQSGIFLDCECGGSSHGSLDGFSFTSCIFFGMRYVFYFGSGSPNLWNMTNNRYDYVGSVLYAIGNSFSGGAIMAFNGGYVTSAQINGPNDANAFHLGSTGGQLILVINGMNLSLCNGCWVIESANCCKRLTFTGNDVGPFGISGKQNTYYGVARTNNQNAFTNVTGNTFTSTQGTGQATIPVYLEGQLTVVGNNIMTGAFSYGIRIFGNGGAFAVTGNTISGTSTGSAFFDQTSSAVVKSTGNFFDKPSNVTHDAGS